MYRGRKPMKKYTLLGKGLTVGIVLLFIGASVVSGFDINSTDNSQTLNRGWLYVGGTGGGNYTTIQSAINAANPGDTIFVYSGTYYENVVVNNKSINLVGENKDTTIIDGGGTGNVVNVSSDGVTISGFTVQHSGSWSFAGITLYYSNDNTFIDNIISNNHGGIHLISSVHNTISDNNVNSNNNIGIYLESSSNNIITGNSASNNGYGIYLGSSNNNNITGSNVNSNNHEGIYLSSSNNNNITGNNVNSNHHIGIYLESSNNNILKGNDANSNNDYGILVEDRKSVV